MANYFIIGGDTKEYGPITEADVRLWISEGRLNTQSSARRETDTNWTLLGNLPEFASVFSTPPTIAPPSATPEFFASPPIGSTDFLQRDYELDLGGCITRGWELVKGNLAVFLVGVLIYLLVQGAASALSNIPLIGPLFTIANFVITGPFMGGVLWLFLRGVRGEPAEVGDIFAGFKRAFGQLFLVTLVQSLLIGLCMTPFIIVLIMKFLATGLHFNPLDIQNNPAAAEQFIKTFIDLLIVTLPVLLMCLIPAVYLGTCWKFSLPLVMDKGMDFWTAMKTSFKMVNKHWWQVFGLMILIGLLNMAGFMACCVGLLFTVPVGFAALMFAYDTIFGERKN